MRINLISLGVRRFSSCSCCCKNLRRKKDEIVNCAFLPFCAKPQHMIPRRFPRMPPPVVIRVVNICHVRSTSLTLVLFIVFAPRSGANHSRSFCYSNQLSFRGWTRANTWWTRHMQSWTNPALGTNGRHGRLAWHLVYQNFANSSKRTGR